MTGGRSDERPEIHQPDDNMLRILAHCGGENIQGTPVREQWTTDERTKQANKGRGLTVPVGARHKHKDLVLDVRDPTRGHGGSKWFEGRDTDYPRSLNSALWKLWLIGASDDINKLCLRPN